MVVICNVKWRWVLLHSASYIKWKYCEDWDWKLFSIWLQPRQHNSTTTVLHSGYQISHVELLERWKLFLNITNFHFIMPFPGSLPSPPLVWWRTASGLHWRLKNLQQKIRMSFQLDLPVRLCKDFLLVAKQKLNGRVLQIRCLVQIWQDQDVHNLGR